jgi:hypothetical protein
VRLPPVPGTYRSTKRPFTTHIELGHDRNRATLFEDRGTVPILRGTDLQGALTSIQTGWAEVEKDVSYGSPVGLRIRKPAFSIQDLP